MLESSRLRRALAGTSIALFLLHAALGARVLWHQVRLLALGQGDDLMSGAELDALVGSVSELLRMYNYGVALSALLFIPLFALCYRHWAAPERRGGVSRTIWCWFVPVLNLYLPYRLAQDIEEGRSSRRDGWALFFWWTTWIASWGASIAASLLVGQGRILDAARWDAAWAALMALSALLGALVIARWGRAAQSESAPVS